MKLRVIKKNIKTFEERLKEKSYDDLAKCFSKRFYGDDNRSVEVTLDCKIDLKQIKLIVEVAEELNDIYAKNDSVLIVQMLRDTKGVQIKSLNGFMKAFEAYIKTDMIDGWVYHLDNSGNYMPELVDSVKHVPHNPDTNEKAHVVIYFDCSFST